ncbi:MAG: A/G-specific adenine glycosylase [Actinobacteria bacterium]|nr:A/G-specific adenine glycosylase [Actinomycetota bacterium]
MLQQTPVPRVIPYWTTWMDCWPTPAGLAHATPAAVIRAWGTLGYPRRATRLHEAARTISNAYGGEVPDTYENLIALPGVGDYTANAVLAFAFHKRTTVLDVNVRRVISRAWRGEQHPPAHLTTIERALADSLVPTTPHAASTWAAASMELGAVLCTTTNPQCTACPLTDTCAWNTAGQPKSTHTTRRQPTYTGSDRQERGRILALLRAHDTLTAAALEKDATNPEQHIRARDSLLADGLIATTGRHLHLP